MALQYKALRFTSNRLSRWLLLLALTPALTYAKNLAYDQPAATVHPQLTAHSRTMTQRVEKVTDRVYKAIGYDIANSVMVVGDNGTVIVDVMGSMRTAKQVAAEFRKITDLPTKALVYTHHHGDHVNGGPAFLDVNSDAAEPPRIFAHQELLPNLAQQAGLLVPITASRAFFMYGNYLEKGAEGLVNAGIGPALVPGQPRFVPPTDLVDDSRQEQIAGLNVEFVHVPSEARDEIALWFPDLKVLHTGEVLQGESFPNIYTIRGDTMRDPLTWVKAIDRLRQYPAEVLVRSHGRAIVGKEKVAETLTAYRDAIQYVHDQTVRYINKGYTPDELVTVVGQLPPHLATHPELQEFYGTVKHAVRAIYQQYLGWFTGDPATLDPLPPLARAQRYLAAMGGREAVLRNASQALAEGDFRWAAEVAGYLITVDKEDRQARQLKADAFKQLAYGQINVNWRNFYLTAAKELEGKAPRDLGMSALGVMQAMPAATLLQQLGVRIDADKAQETQLHGQFELDNGERYGLEIRRGVVEFHPSAPSRMDFSLKLAGKELAQLCSGTQSLDQLLAAGSVTVSGDVKAAERFFALFETPTPWHEIPVSVH